MSKQSSVGTVSSTTASVREDAGSTAADKSVEYSTTEQVSEPDATREQYLEAVIAAYKSLLAQAMKLLQDAENALGVRLD